jgi:uncharacterized heparinase superfamily protein
MIRRAAQAFAFARHMPPEKLIWRLRLGVKRRLALRTRPSLDGPAAPVVASPPQPLFAPRTGRIALTPEGWRFTFVGRTLETGGEIDWNIPGAGARDQLWRMNLHYMEYLEELGAEEGLDLIRQWIAANPPYRAGFWHDSWNSYALSLRLVCWMQFLARHATYPPDILASLVQQLRFLERNLERDLGGNHLMKNIKALGWASAFFDGPEAGRWRRTAWRLLRRELRSQLLADGVHYERSPSYHAQVLADLLELRHATGSTEADSAIAGMVQAATDLSHPDGGAALFNDAGLTMAYSPAECARAAGRVIERSRVFAYPQAGYFGAHLPRFSIVADLGRVGPDDLPAHAHGDIGSFELSVGGLRFIVDQGVYEYVAGERRVQSRAAASHAALALDGAEQAEFFGAFRCGRRPKVAVDRWEPRPDGFVLEGRHDGYSNLPGGPIAVRCFEVDAEAVRITDRIEGRTDRRASVGLLLHPACTVRLEQGRAIVEREGQGLEVRSTVPITVEPALWWPDMGHEQATSRLRLTWPADCVDGRIILSPVKAA